MADIITRTPIILDKQFYCPFEKPFGYIYLVTNELNGHMYVGQHVFHEPRLDTKYIGSGVRLHRAYSKYGIANFTTKILEWIGTNKYDLDNAEVFWIDLLGTFYNDDHYNLTKGGLSTYGYRFTEEQREKIRLRVQGVNNPNYGNKWTQEQRNKLSTFRKEYTKTHAVYNKGKKMNKEFCEKISKAKLGKPHKPHTEETKNKIRLANSGVNSYMYGKPAHNRGKKMSEEQKKKLSIACMGRNKGKSIGCCKCHKIVRLTLDLKPIKTYNSLNEAKEDGFITRTLITACCRGVYKQYKGYKWMYYEDYLLLNTRESKED